MNTYLDGALYHNNPVWVAHHERKLIWPDVCNSPPDILLSIGTGKNTLEDEELPRQSSMSPVSPTSPTSSSSRSWSSRTKPKRRRRDVLPHALLKIAIDRLDNLLECNKIWDSYVADTSTSDYSKISSINRKRSIRLNPDLRFEVPRLDAVEELERVEIAAMQDLKANKEYVVEVAHRLIASTFFFEKDSNSVRATDNGYECTGEYLSS